MISRAVTAGLLALGLALPAPAAAGLSMLRARAGAELAGTAANLEEALGHRAGMEEPEPGLDAAERQAAQDRYRLPPEGLVVEYDPARSVPCALGHPPLLVRVRVLETATGQPTYIGTGCCQTLFGVTPSDLAAAQTAATRRRDRVVRYARLLGETPDALATVQAIHQERLPPESWRSIDTLLAALDRRYDLPIAELERIAGELPARLLPRLTQAGLIAQHEAQAVAAVLARLSPPILEEAPTPEEIQTLRTVHGRLAKHPAFLQIRTLRSWARREAATPLTEEELAREEPRQPTFAANLWVASHLLPGIQAGTITAVLEGGSGQEPLFRLLERLGG